MRRRRAAASTRPTSTTTRGRPSRRTSTAASRPRRDQALDLHGQRLGRRRRRDQQRLGRDDHDLRAERDHAQPRADQARPARPRGVRPRRSVGLPDRRERDRERGALGRRRHDQDLRLDRLAERVGGLRAPASRAGATASSRSRTARRSRRTGPARRAAASSPRAAGHHLDSEVSKNQAANGGGLYSGGHISQFGLRGTFDVRNAQIFENIAENGGGIYNDGDAQLVRHRLDLHEEPLVGSRRRDRELGPGEHDAHARRGRSRTSRTARAAASGRTASACRRSWTRLFTKNKAGVPIIEEDGMLSDDVAGGGGLHTDGGPVDDRARRRSTATRPPRRAAASSIHNLGDVKIGDSVIRTTAPSTAAASRTAPHAGHLRARTAASGRNRAEGGAGGGGIYNTSSGEFHILDSTIRENSGVIGGGLANAPDNRIIIARLAVPEQHRAPRRSTRTATIEENAGRGGGIMSFADGDSLFENTTISGNKAAVAGGGVFHDADGELRLTTSRSGATRPRPAAASASRSPTSSPRFRRRRTPPSS